VLLFDISREILSAEVYEGDPKPSYQQLKSIGDGERFNLSTVTMCTHTATHIDAPLHFDEEGEDIASMRISRFYGKCTVVTIDGVLTGEDMEQLLPHCQRRLILHSRGKAFLSVSAARVIADSKLLLVGTDAMSIAPPFDEMMPHLELARAGVAVLEGLYLEGVEDGVYTLSAFPLKLGGLEAAPCRAVLMREKKGYY
jgi:arylformamidase